MTLTLDLPSSSGWPQSRPWYGTDVKDAPEDGRPWTYIFCVDELPEFCGLLLKKCRINVDSLKEAVLYININSAITNGQVKEIDDHPAGRARMERLLGPLRSLYSLGAARIDGPLSGSYKDGIVRSICKHRPTVMDIVHETMASLEQADEQASKGQHRQANFEYKAALSLIRPWSWIATEPDFVMSDGPFPGLGAYEVMQNIVVRLQARIAAVYYRSNELRMARLYIDRALDPRRTNYHELHILPWQRIVFAEVLHVDAMISYTHGNVRKAMYSLSQAREFVPFDEEQESRYEAWQPRVDRLAARDHQKWEARGRHAQKQNEKAEGISSQQSLSPGHGRRRLTNSTSEIIQVVSNWKRKGERLFRSGRSYLAASVFQTAFKKLEWLSYNHDLNFAVIANTIKEMNAVDAVQILAFSIEAWLAAASLKSRNYEEVVTQTDSALKCDDEEHSYIYRCESSYSRFYNSIYSRFQDSYDDGWEEDRKLDYLRIHYCRAMALYHLGDTVTAVKHMEEALRLDPGDNAVFEKLTMMKQTLKSARKPRLEKLNRPQNRLREKQARRRTKNLRTGSQG